MSPQRQAQIGLMDKQTRDKMHRSKIVSRNDQERTGNCRAVRTGMLGVSSASF